MKRGIFINPEFEHLEGFVNQIPLVFEDIGTTIYEDRNIVKNIKAPDGTMLNVKRYRIPKGINRYVYSSGIRKPKGKRAFIYPQRLIDKGIETPEPIAYIEERHCGILGYSYFISLYCPYEHRMFDVGNAPEGTYEDLAVCFAQFTANLHEKDLLHADYSPGNILYRKTSDGKFLFSLVDINRFRFGPVSQERGLLNLRRLWGPKRFFIMMIEEYARCRGFNVEESLAFAVNERRKFWQRYGKKHKILFKLEL